MLQATGGVSRQLGMLQSIANVAAAAGWPTLKFFFRFCRKRSRAAYVTIWLSNDVPAVNESAESPERLL